jgi:hypothetical protein
MTAHDPAIATSCAVIDRPYSKKSVQCAAHIWLRLRRAMPFVAIPVSLYKLLNDLYKSKKGRGVNNETS